MFQSIKVTGFDGNGYVQMPGLTFNEGSSLGFVFQTTQEDTSLMSGFKDINYNSAEEADSFIISVIDGQIKIRIKNGNRELKLASNVSVNDGHFHVLSLSKVSGFVELRIDDILNDRKMDIDVIDICEYVYFGGVPDNIKLLLTPTDFSTTENLRGTIRDILYKNR